ncbi:MAG: SMP-30/gluconolactonase/LRE family protein [Halobacteriales archaeon]
MPDATDEPTVPPDPDRALYSPEETRVVGADTYLETYLDHPEGVAVSRDGTVYASGEDGQVYRIRGETEVDLLASTGGSTLGVTLTPDEESLYVCDFQRHALFRLDLDGGDPAVELQGSEEEPPIQPNFAAFDGAGRLFLSDSGDRRISGAETGGRLLYRDTGGTWHTLTDRFSAWTNGLAFSRDFSTLYVVESRSERLWALSLSGTEITDATLVADDLGIIDGIALDANDDVYVAATGRDAVYRVRDGETELLLHDPVGRVLCRPTNLAFGGPEIQTLYIAQLGLAHLTAIDLDAKGRYPTARL